jgi:hypothetical protein
MRCEDCGATNLDGADNCSACGHRLLPEEASRGGSGGAPRSTWILLGVATVAAVVLVGALMTSGGPGGGGGGGGPAAPSVESTQVAKASEVSTRVVTPAQRDRVLAAATPIIKKKYADLSKVAPNVVSYEFHGTVYVDAAYETRVRLQGSKGPMLVPRSVIVSLDESTGEVTTYATD